MLKNEAKRRYRAIAIWVLSKVRGIPRWYIESVFGITRQGRLHIVRAVEKMEWAERQALISGSTQPPTVYVGDTSDVARVSDRERTRH
jgi:hypothetical protein